MMRTFRVALAPALCSAFALSDASAQTNGAASQVFRGNFGIHDSEDPELNNCTVYMVGTEMEANGTVQGVGTGGEQVSINYWTNEPTFTTRNSRSAKVKQGTYSNLILRFVSNGQTDVNVNPEKCAIDGSANSSKGTGSVTLKCQGGDLDGLLSAAQIASLDTAFANNRRVKLRANESKQTWAISVTCRGAGSFRP